MPCSASVSHPAGSPASGDSRRARSCRLRPERGRLKDGAQGTPPQQRTSQRGLRVPRASSPERAAGQLGSISLITPFWSVATPRPRRPLVSCPQRDPHTRSVACAQTGRRRFEPCDSYPDRHNLLARGAASTASATPAATATATAATGCRSRALVRATRPRPACGRSEPAHFRSSSVDRAKFLSLGVSRPVSESLHTHLKFTGNTRGKLLKIHSTRRTPTKRERDTLRDATIGCNGHIYRKNMRSSAFFSMGSNPRC